MNGHSPQEPELHEICTSSPPCQAKGKVDVRSIKTLVFNKFSQDSAIYAALLTERDILNVPEYLVKVDVWLKLLRRTKH
jgi:hypothetical protein